MNVTVYCRGKVDKKPHLHKFKVDDAPDVATAIDEVRSELSWNGDTFYEPVLAFIKGGKNE